MYEDDLITISTTAASGKITVPATGTGYSSGTYTITNGGYIHSTIGGGGGGSSSLSQSGSNWGVISVTPSVQQATILISGEGEIYRGTASKGNGLFERLEKLERMLGILRRERTLEEQYEPLKEMGDRYDAACDKAIGRIIDAALSDLGDLADRYTEMTEQARVFTALSKEP